jgi:hypothetical protein
MALANELLTLIDDVEAQARVLFPVPRGGFKVPQLGSHELSDDFKALYSRFIDKIWEFLDKNECWSGDRIKAKKVFSSMHDNGIDPELVSKLVSLSIAQAYDVFCNVPGCRSGAYKVAGGCRYCVKHLVKGFTCINDGKRLAWYCNESIELPMNHRHNFGFTPQDVSSVTPIAFDAIQHKWNMILVKSGVIYKKFCDSKYVRDKKEEMNDALNDNDRNRKKAKINYKECSSSEDEEVVDPKKAKIDPKKAKIDPPVTLDRLAQTWSHKFIAQSPDLASLKTAFDSVAKAVNMSADPKVLADASKGGDYIVTYLQSLIGRVNYQASLMEELQNEKDKLEKDARKEFVADLKALVAKFNVV